MSCFLPSSVMLKSAGFRPLIGLPLLSFTVTSTTTNWVVVANLKPPLGAAGGGVCAARCVCGGIAESTSRLRRHCRKYEQAAQECGENGSHSLKFPLKSNPAEQRPASL